MLKTQSLIIKGVENQEELRRAHQLMTQLSRAPHQTTSHWLTQHAQRYPRFQQEHTRIALHNEEVIAALRINTDILRIGEARLKVGGIAWIAVDPNIKSPAPLKHLIEETTAYLLEHRYHLSILFAPPKAYSALGYITCLNDQTLNLPVTDIPPAHLTSTRIRSIKPGDISALIQLHRLNYTHITCSILREYTHMSIKWEQLKPIKVFTDTQGKIEGYLLAYRTGKDVSIYEISALNETVYSTILAHAKSLTKDQNTAQLIFHIPKEHPITTYLGALPSPIEFYPADTAQSGLMRIIDIEETLESMIPEWEHQLHKSLLREMDCEVTLLIDAAPYRIRVHYGVMDIAKQLGKNKFTVTHQIFCQLLCGYEHFSDAWSQDRRLINREGKALLEVLFPKRNPYITPLDRY